MFEVSVLVVEGVIVVGESFTAVDHHPNVYYRQDHPDHVDCIDKTQLNVLLDRFKLAQVVFLDEGEVALPHQDQQTGQGENYSRHLDQEAVVFKLEEVEDGPELKAEEEEGEEEES